MEQLIKITSVPMRTMRLSQNARLVSSDSVDMERRKALARQMSFRRTHTSGSSLPMDDITRINRTFSRRNTTPQTQNVSRQQEISRQQTLSRQQMTASSASLHHRTSLQRKQFRFLPTKQQPLLLRLPVTNRNSPLLIPHS